MEEFKIGAKVACYIEQGSYSKCWKSPEIIVRETKTLYITDKGSKFYKTDHRAFGTRTEVYYNAIYYIWTTEMEIKRNQVLLKKNLEKEISDALGKHRFSVTQLQYIKSMLNN